MCLRTSLSAGLLLDISVIVMYICTCVILLSSQTTIWQSHVNSCLSCQFMSFMPIHGIHANSWHSGQFMAFMPIHGIHANSCQLCQFMSVMSIHSIRVICHWTFPESQKIVWCGVVWSNMSVFRGVLFGRFQGS
jgi:hypothetical protein